MKTVYAVASGDYSDYGIEAIFSTKEKAERFITVANSNINCWSRDRRIEEYVMDEKTEFIDKGFKEYVITMDFTTGNIALDADNIPCITERPYPIYGKINSYHTWGARENPRSFTINVKAKDQKTAIKIASDVRRQVYAEHPDASWENRVEGTF